MPERHWQMSDHICIKLGCHTSPTDILIHGQQIQLANEEQIIQNEILILKELREMAATLAQVKADFETYKGNVTKAFADIKAAFARLQASIDANTLDPQALQDLDDSVNSANVDALTADTDANAEDPDATPAPEPAPEPTV